jgi:ParB family transcriptional regulator, chromosome partitioning protein
VKLSKPELEAVIAASSRTFVPFNKLVLSTELQARPDDGKGPQSLTELAASIHAAGLLHNLVVVRGAKTLYEVCAGGRRWRAMGMLVADGRWPENQPVPVLVVAAEQALIASLVENVQREAMHPADEFEAFARLIARGRSVEDVAAVFGVTPLVVQRRLRLAAIAPSLMAQYRAGRIALDCLMVLATIEDRVRQEAAWAQAPAWARSADQLRRLLARDEAESDTDPVARFVGVAAYEAAGGAVRRDLFSDDDKAWLLDVPLLDRLAIDRLQPVAEGLLAEGWRWVDVRPRYVYEDYTRHGEVRSTLREPTAEEDEAEATLRTRIETIHGKLDALSDAEEEVDEDAYAGLEADEELLQAQLAALEETRQTYPPDCIATSGCVVCVGARGEPEVKRGLVRPEDRAAFQAARNASGDRVTGASMVREVRPASRAVHSDRLMRMLTAHRVAAVQAELLERPDVALAALTAHLAAKVLRDAYDTSKSVPQTLTVSASDTHESLRGEGEEIALADAWKAMQGMRVEWEAALPKDGAALLGWVLSQDREVVLRLLAFLVASTVTGVEGTERDSCAMDGLATALGLDMRRWWQATGQSYLGHVSKARILEVVTEVAGAPAAAGLEKLKKDAVVAGAQRALEGKGWLPRCLQTRRADAG